MDTPAIINAFERALKILTSDDTQDVALVVNRVNEVPHSAVLVVTGREAASDLVKILDRLLDGWDRRYRERANFW
jgi:hypothetical protein